MMSVKRDVQMGRKKSLGEWQQQLTSDKQLYEQAKKDPHIRRMQTGTTSDGKPIYALGYYGRLYRQSLAGYRRAKRRRMGWSRKGRLAHSRVPLGHPLHRIRTKSQIPEAVEQSKNDLLQKEEELLYSGQGWDIVGRRRVTDLVTGELEKRAHEIHGENIELKWISGNLDGLKTYSLMVRPKPKFLSLKVGDSIGFEKEFRYLGMGAEPAHKRRYKYIPITKVTDKGLEFTETMPPYKPNVFFIPWDTINKYLKEGKYKIRRGR